MYEKEIEYLKGFITEQRWNRMQEVLSQRTRYLQVALENIYQPHNASAVLRSCDSFGIQDVHAIQKSNNFRVNPEISMGTGQWLSIHRYKGAEISTTEVMNSLRGKGYRIIATSPRGPEVPLNSFNLDKGPAVLFFGTELKGLSEEAMDGADEHLKIPMYGFVESFNISVSAGILLHSLTERLRLSSLPWLLNEHEQNDVLFTWLKNSVKNSDKILQAWEGKE